MQVTPSIFKAYDIRGTTPTTINEPVAEALGLAFGTTALALGEKTVAVKKRQFSRRGVFTRHTGRQ